MSELKPSYDELVSLLEDAQKKNRKLSKINQALIDRVEAGGSNRYDAYSTFENSVHLAKQVREKTEALNETLVKLERSNRDLTKANKQSNLFKQRFIDAIESISDAFVLLDNEGRIILQNSHFSNFWRNSNLPTDKGVNLRDLKELAKVRGIIRQAYPGDADTSPVYQLNDGRWFQLNERSTVEGGWVMLYTDITALKVAESARFERAIEQKSQMLQSLVDNLSQGVVLVNGDNKVEIWNKRFSEISHLSPSILGNTPYFNTLQSLTELDLLSKSSEGEAFYVQELSNGMVVEVREHAISNDQLVKTYTDITERHQYAVSLERRKNWLRLITDNVPAMIAYIGADLKFQFTNRVYVDWYGLQPDSLNGVTLEESRTQGDYNKLRPYVEIALSGNSVSFEIEEMDLENRISYQLKSYVPNKDSNGQVLGFFVLVRNITSRRESALALQRAHDQLELRVTERTFELQNVNDKLLKEVEDRRKAQANLLSAKKEAEQANQSKSKFLAAVSHDLLQPLNAAKLFTSSVSDMISSPDKRKLIGNIANSLDDLESLICTLVDISKLDAGVVKADKNSFNLGELMDNLVTEYRHLAPQYSVKLHYVRPNLVVNSDSVLLARILRNFLSNAFRYTEQGKVLLGCRRTDEHVYIEVWDNGAGIAEDELSVIFQEFKRLKSSAKAFSNGLGLGLAIVDKLSTVLEHPIKVRSEQFKGSMFSVKVPLGTIVRPKTSQLNPLVQHSNNNLNGAKIWVVDNDQTICEGMAVLLSNWGCEVITATDYSDLANQVDIANSCADLLILDYHLDDGVTGLQVAEQIKQARGESLPMIMITANYSQSLKNFVKKKHILLLNKPVKPMKLKTTMMYLLNEAAKSIA
ncbi:PAS domain-containing hybrid sensor histidine kinase/response regulator [Psychrobium sp. 1_MG-2023]|uniref:hybrid sensor histidine kinase/response regulator n=1 Tax=Psychrobium sp. 1_MG-2023 TaxID=3062624 RepID=UPI000C327F45|nr:PAS domain-containing hybrid sensor histidine kinase/response regulator [Psychrobium sp. 1_MG-2023]MDP2561576.1 NahK/ErcS family hybrid sensor histidine kinase/response regulator [Psychrobium sp. 1_MG-2023]PKF55037.1 hybrid sensor histidine kinase/response regulator [Alteromonadales bacterium alter-6D02]